MDIEPEPAKQEIPEVKIAEENNPIGDTIEGEQE